MTDATEYPIYGGPLHGGKQPLTATIYADRTSGSTRITDFDRAYRYQLVEHDGRRAFLPVDDRDLVAAFHDTDGDPDGAAATMLAAELQQRELDL